MAITLKHYFIIFLKAFSEMFFLQYAFAAKHAARAKVLDKRFRPEQHFEMVAMARFPVTVEHAWLVEVEINEKQTEVEVEVSEKFYELVEEGDNLFVQYQMSWIDDGIKAKLLQ